MRRAFTGLLFVLLAAGCSRSPEYRAGRFLRSGMDYLARKDYSRAELDLRNACRLAPRNSEAFYQLGVAYLGNGDINQGIAALLHALELNPKHSGANVKMAELMAASGDAGLAKNGEQRMSELLKRQPGNVDALNALALAEMQSGDATGAEKNLNDALGRMPGNLRSNVELALLDVARKDFAGAEKALEQARNAAPSSAEAAVALAQLYNVEGRRTDAEGEFQRALAISPKDPHALVGLATIARAAGRKDQAEKLYRRLSELNNPQYRDVHAAFLFAEGQRDVAIRELSALARQYPADRTIRNRLVAADIVTGRLDDAGKVLATALAKNPADVDALLQRSGLLIRAGKDEQAEADLNQVIHFKPDSARAHYLLARIYELRGIASRQNAELTEAVHQDTELLPARVELAQMLVVSGSPKAALEVLDATPADERGRLVVALERNAANYAAGDKTAFRAGVARTLAAVRGLDTLLQDSVAKVMDRDYAGAAASADAALQLDPDDLRALNARVYIFQVRNQATEAVRFLSDYGRRSKSAAATTAAGEWLWMDGARADAVDVLNRAKSLDPAYARAHLMLAEAEIAEGRNREAEAELQQVFSRTPRNASAEILMARLKTSEHDFAGAVTLYRNALDARPRDPAALNNVAYLLAEDMGQPDAALDYAQRAVELNPASPDYAGTLGWVLYRKGLYRQAAENLLRSVTEDRDDRRGNAVVRKYHLAMAYAKTGDMLRGKQVLAQALRQNADLPEAEKARAALHEQ